MDPFTLMLLFGAGSTIFGAGMGLAQNAQSQAMSEEAMQQQFENQMALQKDAQSHSLTQMRWQQKFAQQMWEQNNEYNSQSAIDQRLRDAGRNPYLSNNANVASVATSPGSASGAGQGSAALANPQFTPITALAQHFMNSGLQSTQMLSFLEDVKGKKIDNMFKASNYMANLKKLGVDIESGQLKNYAQRLTNMFARDMLEQDYITKLETNKNLRLQGESMGYTIAAQALQNAYLPQQLKLDVTMKNAELFTEYQRGQLTKSQYKHELVQILLSEQKVEGQKLDNEGKAISNKRATIDYTTAAEIADYIVEKARIESYPEGPMGLNRTVHDWRDRMFPYDLERSRGGRTLYLK